MSDASKNAPPFQQKDSASEDGKEEIFEFPCDFPLKVMGLASPEFQETLTKVVEQFDPTLDRSRIEVRPSKSGTYTGLTLIIHAQSRAQLDDIYRAVTSHPMVKYVL
jgi:putative lipoic acid-binding regulatory protein